MICDGPTTVGSETTIGFTEAGLANPTFTEWLTFTNDMAGVYALTLDTSSSGIDFTSAILTGPGGPYNGTSGGGTTVNDPLPNGGAIALGHPLGMSGARIAGTGSYLPPRRVTNAELAAELAASGIETSDQWIIERTPAPIEDSPSSLISPSCPDRATWVPPQGTPKLP